jgi:serine protease Do
MRRSGLVALLVWGVVLPTAWAQVDRAALVLVGAKVLKVEVLRQQGGYSLGSGVVVGDGQVITNCHVTRDGIGIHVLRGDNRWRAEAQARDAEHDLCLLRVPGLLAEPGVKLGAAQHLKVGQSVTAVGYTGGLGIQSSSGNITGLHRYDGTLVIQSDNWFSSGASGGALFDDQLNLVGVLTFRLRGGNAHYFAAPTEWLQPMLDGRMPYEAVGPGDARELAYWQKPAEQQPLFLQAVALARDMRWIELEALSARWTGTDATDPAPWAMWGLALEQLGKLGDAQRALERSVAIDPTDGPVWLRLGQIYARQGALELAQEVRYRLDRLAPDLARQLDLRPAGS